VRKQVVGQRPTTTTKNKLFDQRELGDQQLRKTTF
jgi:hypothetical protein